MRIFRVNVREAISVAFVSGILWFVAAPVHAAPLPKADVKYAQVGDVKLAYYIRGEGKPLLMIMGFAGTMAWWDPALVDELAKNRLLIMFDNRGAGLSTDTEENHTTMAQMADDAAGLIKALGFDKADVLAWSMGARIGQQLLIRHPEVVNKGILCAPDPGGSHSVPPDPDVGAKLNNPNGSLADETDLLFTNDAAGKTAAQESLSRIRAAVTNNRTR